MKWNELNRQIVDAIAKSGIADPEINYIDISDAGIHNNEVNVVVDEDGLTVT